MARSVRKALRQRLLSVSGIGDRVYSHSLPQEATLPAIVLTRITAGHQHTLTAPAGFAVSRWQVTCWAETQEEADDTAHAARLLLDAYKGTVTADGDDYELACEVIEGGDLALEDVPAEAQRRYAAYLDVYVAWDEPAS